MFWEISELYGIFPKIIIQKSTLLSHTVIIFLSSSEKNCKLIESKSNDFLNVNQFTFCKKKRHDDQILYRIQQGISTQIPRSKKIAFKKNIFFVKLEKIMLFESVITSYTSYIWRDNFKISKIL